MSSYPEPRAQPASPRRSRIYYGWYVVAAAVIISVAVGGASEGLSFFRLPMSQHFGWSYASFAVVAAIGALTNGLTQPIVGYLFDRFNSRRVILISVAAMGLATVALVWTSHYWHLVFLFGFVFSGAMGGASFGVLGPLAARWFLNRRTLVLSLLLAASTMGSIFSPSISGLFLTYISWREAVMALGAILLFIALPPAMIFVRNWPSDRGLKPDGNPETPMEARMRGSAPEVQRGRYEVERWWRAFRSPPTWALVPVFAIGGFADTVGSTFSGPFGNDSLLLGPERIAVSHTVMAVLGPVGAVAVGLVADRFARKKVLGALFLAQGIAFLVLITVPFGFSLLLFAVLAGLSGTTWMIIALSLIADVYGLRALATLWGIAFLFRSIGSLVGGVWGGLAIALGGYHLSFAVCALMLVLASIAVFRINERKHSARYQANVEDEAVGN